MKQNAEKHSQSRAFLIISVGQIVSLLGSGFTNFALSLWVLKQTGSATQFALLIFLISLPGFLVLPLAGAFADRMDRRLVMILSDLGAAFSILAIALLFMFAEIQVWQIAVCLAMSAMCGAFRTPAYLASVSMLVPKEQLGRANGVVQLGEAAGKILSPVVAGLLVNAIHIQGILLIDFATFLCALTTLLIARIPRPESSAGEAKSSLWKEATMGWAYIRSRHGMLALLLFFVMISFMLAMAEVLVPALLVATASFAIIGTIVSVFGSGLLAGSVVMSAWGGPRRRIYGVYLFAAVHALALVLAGVSRSLPVIAAGLFLWTFSLPFLNGCMRVIYQVKTPADMQGRVFAVASMVVQATMPVGLLLAGVLADRVFEPMLQPGGRLAANLGRLIGAGPGRGIGMMLILMGGVVILGLVAGYLYPRLRLVETELPDALADAATQDGAARLQQPSSAAEAAPPAYHDHKAAASAPAAATDF
jgi:MFS transporter, DHA3 family, macrolide efflux protein